MPTLNPEDQARIDQAFECILQNIPPMLFSMYKRLLSEGFNPEQSLELCRTYLMVSLNRSK